MKATNITILLVTLAVFILSSFTTPSDSFQDSNCNLDIVEINDSTYVVTSNSTLSIETKVVSGSVSVQVSNDTITVSGSSYVVAVYAFDQNDCAKTRLITKFN